MGTSKSLAWHLIALPFTRFDSTTLTRSEFNQWCSLLDKDDIELMEYYNDLKVYYNAGSTLLRASHYF